MLFEDDPHCLGYGGYRSQNFIVTSKYSAGKNQHCWISKKGEVLVGPVRLK